MARTKGGKDVNGRIMGTIAGKMTDDQMSVADYMAGLRCERRAHRRPELYQSKAAAEVALARADAHVTGLAAAGIHDREWMVVDGHAAFVTQRELPRLALVPRQSATAS